MANESAVKELYDEEKASLFSTMAGKYGALYSSIENVNNQGSEVSVEGYNWVEWERKISTAFSQHLPIDFLRFPQINSTMVYKSVRSLDERLMFIEKTFGKNLAGLLLREDSIGYPRIANREWKTSASRAHIAFHLAKFVAETGASPATFQSAVEWGGGYGCFARVFRKFAPNATYVIVDLPALLCLQYVYLGTLEGEDSVNLVATSNQHVVEGKINFVPTTIVDSVLSSDAAFDFMVSTWALTESPIKVQQRVCDRNFVNAKHVLLAYNRDRYNGVMDRVRDATYRHVPMDILAREGRSGHEYAFK